MILFLELLAKEPETQVTIVNAVAAIIIITTITIITITTIIVVMSTSKTLTEPNQATRKKPGATSVRNSPVSKMNEVGHLEMSELQFNDIPGCRADSRFRQYKRGSSWFFVIK